MGAGSCKGFCGDMKAILQIPDSRAPSEKLYPLHPSLQGSRPNTTSTSASPQSTSSGGFLAASRGTSQEEKMVEFRRQQHQQANQAPYAYPPPQPGAFPQGVPGVYSAPYIQPGYGYPAASIPPSFVPNAQGPPPMVFAQPQQQPPPQQQQYQSPWSSATMVPVGYSTTVMSSGPGFASYPHPGIPPASLPVSYSENPTSFSQGSPSVPNTSAPSSNPPVGYAFSGPPPSMALAAASRSVPSTAPQAQPTSHPAPDINPPQYFSSPGFTSQSSPPVNSYDAKELQANQGTFSRSNYS